MLIGYVRVAQGDDQSDALQAEAVKIAGCSAKALVASLLDL
jgi:hypothetical protein